MDLVRTEAEAPELVAIPVLGDIPAGVPMERALTHHAEEHIAVDLKGLAQRGDILFALRVEGRSMVGYGIYPGDYAVCSMVQGYAVGDVVAYYQMETGDSTIKQLGAWKPGNRTIQLVPHNGAEGLLPFRVDMSPSDQLRRVVLIVRRYRTRL